MVIAKYTTPGITYKPRKVAITDIDKVFLVIRQNGCEVITKDIDDATINDGQFIFDFSQEETAKLCVKVPATVQIDYMSGAERYTTNEVACVIVDSAVREVIT